MKQSIFLLLVAAVLSGCTGGTIYSHYQSMPFSGWPADSAMDFTFPVTDTIAPFDMVVNIRHSDLYPFQNIFLFTQLYAGEQLLATDTLEYYLADPRGRWLGNGYGRLHDMPMLIRQRIVFPRSGEYRLSVRQGMRMDPLSGVSDLGLTVTLSE